MVVLQPVQFGVELKWIQHVDVLDGYLRASLVSRIGRSLMIWWRR
jgi:hypothetical protein